MKKNKREIYLILSNEVNTSLCSFCRYSKSDGSYCLDDEGCIWCAHPIDAISDGIGEDLEPDSDCWGYNPALALNDMVDLIGIILANGWTNWTWWREDLPEPGQVIGAKKQIYIWGRKSEQNSL